MTDGLSVLVWEPEAEPAFKQLTKALLQASALSLPTGQEFNLHVTERGMALGVLTQPRGQTHQPVGDLSKETQM